MMRTEFFINRDVLIIMGKVDEQNRLTFGHSIRHPGRWSLITRASLVLLWEADSLVLVAYKYRLANELDDEGLRYYGVPIVLPSAVAVQPIVTRQGSMGAVQISRADHFALEVMAGWYS